MKAKTAETKAFDKVLKAMLTTRPLSKEEISARIRARRKDGRKDKQAGRSKS
jgi:hypothetical protein